MKFENTRVFNFEGAFRGMRNPKESYHLSDSKFLVYGELEDEDWLSVIANKWAEDYLNKNEILDAQAKMPVIVDQWMDYLIINGHFRKGINIIERNYIGPKDMKLAQQLIRAGSEHRKFMRQIFVSVDITAPLYWY